MKKVYTINVCNESQCTAPGNFPVLIAAPLLVSTPCVCKCMHTCIMHNLILKRLLFFIARMRAAQSQMQSTSLQPSSEFYIMDTINRQGLIQRGASQDSFPFENCQVLLRRVLQLICNKFSFVYDIRSYQKQSQKL